MANKLLTIDCGSWEKDNGSVVGRQVNVYNSYLDALNKESSGLAVIYNVNLLDGTIGSAISQTAGSVGPVIDSNGMLNIYVDDSVHSEVFISEVGKLDTTTKVKVNAFGKLSIRRVVVQ